MVYKTTLYINTDILTRIDEAAMITGKKQNEIINALIKFVMKDNNVLVRKQGNVEYQAADPRGNYTGKNTKKRGKNQHLPKIYRTVQDFRLC